MQSYEELSPQLEADHSENVQAARHFEFFWYPGRDSAVVKRIDETHDEPEYPLGDEGGRVAWNYEVLPNHRTWPHTEMEYSVPAEPRTGVPRRHTSSTPQRLPRHALARRVPIARRRRCLALDSV